MFSVVTKPYTTRTICRLHAKYKQINIQFHNVLWSVWLWLAYNLYFRPWFQIWRWWNRSCRQRIEYYCMKKEELNSGELSHCVFLKSVSVQNYVWILYEWHVDIVGLDFRCMCYQIILSTTLNCALKSTDYFAFLYIEYSYVKTRNKLI